MVIFSVTFFGVLTWLYEGSIRIKLVLVLFLCLIGMLSEVMVCFIGILCGIDIIHMMGNTEVAIMYTILSKLVWFVEIKIAMLFLKKNKKYSNQKYGLARGVYSAGEQCFYCYGDVCTIDR